MMDRCLAVVVESLLQLPSSGNQSPLVPYMKYLPRVQGGSEQPKGHVYNIRPFSKGVLGNGTICRVLRVNDRVMFACGCGFERVNVSTC